MGKNIVTCGFAGQWYIVESVLARNMLYKTGRGYFMVTTVVEKDGEDDERKN